MEVTVKIEGLAEIETVLRRLPDSTVKNVLRRVERVRLQDFADSARAMVPILSGNLKRSIIVSTRLSRRQKSLHRKQSQDDVEMYAGAGPYPHAHMVEFGSKHNKPHPYLQAAWEQERNRMLELIKDDLWREIEKTIARFARKAAKS